MIKYSALQYLGLQEVWSGGQTGADEAGLEAARLNGLKTNGYAPKNYRTLNGNNLKLKDIYNLKETISLDYKSRTELNAKLTDGTIRFATDFNSSGEICTLRAIAKYRKPYLDVHLPNYNVEIIVNWIIDNNISILNIAGNADRKDSYHYDTTLKILNEVFLKLKTMI